MRTVLNDSLYARALALTRNVLLSVGGASVGIAIGLDVLERVCSLGAACFVQRRRRWRHILVGRDLARTRA